MLVLRMMYRMSSNHRGNKLLPFCKIIPFLQPQSQGTRIPKPSRHAISRCQSTKSSLHARWEENVKSIMKDPPKVVTTVKIHQLQETIKYYMATKKDLKTCFQLLDALCSREVQEIPVIPRKLMEPLVRQWQQKWKEKRCIDLKYGLESPSKMAQRMESYVQNGIISAQGQRIPAMILDAASCSTADDDFAPVQFCMEYLEKWIQDSKRESPDAVVVGTVLQALVNHGVAPTEIETYWLHVSEKLPSLNPNEFWYSSIITAWAKEGNVDKAMEWLNRMREGGCQPDLRICNGVLSALAKYEDWDGGTHKPRFQEHRRQGKENSDEIPEQVEGLLREMQERFLSGELVAPPDVVSYSIVLNAWARRSQKNPVAAQRAETLLWQMQAPNVVSYNTVISAYARAGKPQEAERLLLEMLESSKSSDSARHVDDDSPRKDKVDRLQPNLASFSAVLVAWSQVGTWEAAERAERILKELFPIMGLKPDLVSYCSCLACWGKISNQRGAAERAQAVFDELVLRPDIQPDVVAYTSLMNAYVSQGGAEKVEGIFRELLDDFEAYGSVKLKPNAHTFSVLLSSLVRSNRKDGIFRAEEWLQRMKDDFDVEPNVFSYSIVLEAMSHRAKSNPDFPDRARKLLNAMPPVPNPRPFTAVIRAYAEQGRAEDAEGLLEGMISNPQYPSPDSYTFANVLLAWSKVKKREDFLNAAQRSEKLLARMNKLHQAKELPGPPNIFCFTNVLKAWSRVHNVKGAERADSILQAMESSGIEPNISCYNIVMNAWSNYTGHGTTALGRVQSLMDHARRLGPDEYTYRAYFKAIYNSTLKNRDELAVQVVQEMQERGIRATAFYMDRINQMNSEKED